MFKNFKICSGCLVQFGLLHEFSAGFLREARNQITCRSNSLEIVFDGESISSLEFRKLALVFPEISFSLNNSWHVPGNFSNSLHARFLQIFPDELGTRECIKISAGNLSVHGVVSMEITDLNFLWIFVNGISIPVSSKLYDFAHGIFYGKVLKEKLSLIVLSFRGNFSNRQFKEMTMEFSKRNFQILTTGALRQTEHQIRRNVVESYDKSSLALEKDDIPCLRFIGQFDRKVLLVFLRRANRIICIDQHAASERIVLEDIQANLFDEIFSLDLEKIEKVTILSGKKEFDNLKSIGTAMEKYGWKYQLYLLENEDVIIEVLRTCAMKRFPNLFVSPKHIIQFSNELRDKRIPQMLWYMLTTASCKAAVKFGDFLNVDECKELLMRLANCVHPFQCAHGRPSVYPLPELK